MALFLLLAYQTLSAESMASEVSSLSAEAEVTDSETAVRLAARLRR
jgi:hypothetical protein